MLVLDRNYPGVAVGEAGAFAQVIPEGAGPVKSEGRRFVVSFDILAGTSM